ncbi:radical SAM protein [Sulfurisphaera tokodaii]|nr:radical SAM protein [Sulfurisphaera tokodaii]HII73213.1 radical SAM protein [Sulfurisphaera tokodaii]
MKVLLSSGTYYYLKRGIKVSETAYALQYGGCEGKCKFCTQSVLSNADKTYLSRVKWYLVDFNDETAEKLSIFSRFCLQTVIKKGFVDEVIDILKLTRNKHKSVTITPIEVSYLYKFKELNVDYLGVGLDTVKRLWDYVGKPYTFDEYMKFIKEAVRVFGRGHVYAHLIVGLGETDDELISLMKELKDIGAEVALFAFTPVKGTPFENLERPSLERYRHIQRMRYIIFEGKNSKLAYLTSGCPSCDRPYYNEDPRDKLYNIPLRDFRWYMGS